MVQRLFQEELLRASVLTIYIFSSFRRRVTHRLARSQLKRRRPTVFVRRLLETTSRQQQTQRTLLDWLRVEYEAKH